MDTGAKRRSTISDSDAYAYCGERNTALHTLIIRWRYQRNAVDEMVEILMAENMATQMMENGVQ